MKFIKSLLLGLLLGFVFLIVLVISITFIYEKEVTQYIIEELNESIEVKIDVKDTKFSLLRKFPNASVEFKDVTAFSPSSFDNKILNYKTDTLFSSKRLFLEFNIFDLLKKTYNIKNIHFDQGIINVFIDEYGNENYRFWDSAVDDSSESLKLELSRVKITQTHVLYCNAQQQLVFKTFIEKSTFNGLLFQERFALDIDASIMIETFSLEDQLFISNKNLTADLNLNISKETISILKGDLSIESFAMGITGIIELFNTTHVDLTVKAQNQSLERLFAILPSNLRNEFSNIQTQSGIISLNSTITGELSKSENPSIQGSFQLKKANLFDLSNNLKLNQVFADGEFTNGNRNNLKTSSLKINSFSTSLDKSSASGSLQIDDLSDPSVLINYSADLNFEEIHKTFSIDTLEVLSGSGKIKGTFSGNIKEIKNLHFYDFFKKEFAFNLRINDGQFKLKGNPLIVNHISGLFAINETLYTDSLYFKILDNDFLVTGEATNLYQYFSSDGPTTIMAELNSSSIDLNQLSPVFFVEKSEKKDPTYKFPEQLNLFLNLQIKNFVLGKFSAVNIKGRVNYKPKMFSLHEISFQSMNGASKIGGVIVQDYKNDFIVKIQSNLKNIDISKLFYSFNNFGQTFMIEKNIVGDISGDILFSSLFSDKLEINKKSVVSESNIIINNGALVNFEPMKQLSRFIDVKELEHIKFSTLQNQITIKNEQVIIPKMDIATSAINITISGTHNFDNTFSYHFKVLLSDILAKKAKDTSNDKNESDYFEDDGMGRTNIYLKIVGNPDDYNVSYDRKQAREARKEERQNEKQQLKKILNEEFGWYKNDPDIKSADSLNTKKTNAFKIEWEEKQAVTDTLKKNKNSTQDTKFKIAFDEDSTDLYHKE